MIMMEPRTPCKLCSIKPSILGDGSYYQSDSQTLIAEGGWSGLYFGAEADGRLFMAAVGAGETDHYYPKFCPECGRQLGQGGEEG